MSASSQASSAFVDQLLDDDKRPFDGRVERWLGELAEDLRKKTYRPQPVRRAYIPKPDGRKRPLGISAIRDRVAETAADLVLSPIFDADLQPEQYAYRPGRNAHDAARRIHGLLNRDIGTS